MKDVVDKLFARYEAFFARSLAGQVDADEVTALYASDIIAASPAGVVSGKNDAHFRQIIDQGYAHYRAIGTKSMCVRRIRLSPIDPLHCVAHVGWTAIYIRKDQDDISIDFEVHYLVQILAGDAKVFGWIAGDEQALLKQHGIA